LDRLPERVRSREFSLQIVQARQRRIGTELARMWDSLLSEPIPEEMLEILLRLDERDRG